MSLIFEENEKTDLSSLQQGDVLRRSEGLISAIRQAHRYYSDEAPDYEYFMVLTQSCDLVRRGTRLPKSRYITIAAVRPLDVLLDRFLQKARIDIRGFPLGLYRKENQILVQNILERLLHNTFDGFFFIRQGQHPALLKNYCTFLTLSISLKIDHYDECLGAKAAQMKEIFQAKLGWLTGNLYSRVGTPDEEGDLVEIKSKFMEEVLNEKTIWLTTEQQSMLKRLLKRQKPENEKEARHMIDGIPDDVQAIAERIADQLLQNVIGSKADREKMVKIIRSDQVVSRILREGRSESRFIES
jgi:hypothetical protein